MKDDVVEIVITGEITSNFAEEVRDEVRNIAWTLSAKAMLVDVSSLKGRFSIVEAYRRVRSYPSDKPRIPVAVVDIPENNEYQSFHEMTAYNAGLILKWFTNLDDARTWLKNIKEGTTESL